MVVGQKILHLLSNNTRLAASCGTSITILTKHSGNWYEA